ncbi:MAG TPA: hypothetical protein VH082_10575 [Rudaea sp.]|nr:hypothetical protein [Rudaea sp.]
MNLTLQTRRAVVTLSLMALAMVCIVAKTAVGSDAMLAEKTPAQVESVTRASLEVSAGPVTVRVSVPVKVKSMAQSTGTIIRI